MNFLSLKLFTLFISTFSFAQKPPTEWRFIKEVEGVKVYFRESEGSNIKEVKMQTTFNANLSSIVECLKDVNRYPKWVYKATFSKTILKYSENDVVYYNYIDFPWPMQDRDIVVQSQISQDAITKIVTSESFAKWDAEPFKKDVVRIQDFRSKWIFKPVSSGKVWGEYVFKSNPGGNIPAWLVNLGLDEGPLKTLKGFKKLLAEDQYKNVDNGFKD